MHLKVFLVFNFYLIKMSKLVKIQTTPFLQAQYFYENKEN